MPGTEAEDLARNGDGPLAASAPAGSAAGGSDGREPTAPIAPADADAAAGPAALAEPGHDHPGPRVSASHADEPHTAAAALKAESLEFWIAADITYGRARAGWLMLMHRLMLFGAVVGGTTAATDLAKSTLWAFGAALCATLDLVFDPATDAAEHRNRTRALHDALVALKRVGVDPIRLDEVEIELLKLSATETAPYNALRLMAHNAVTKGLGRDPAHLEYVPWERRWLAQIVRFEGWQDAKRDRWRRFLCWVRGKPYP